MGWVMWTTAAIRMLVPRWAAESAEGESEFDDEDSFIGITIQLENSPEEDDDCDADSSFFGRTLLQEHSPQKNGGYEDDEYIDAQVGPEDVYVTLSEETAKELANENRDLFFSSLSGLSADAAKALAQHKGHLALRELTTLSDKAAKALAQTKGYL